MHSEEENEETPPTERLPIMRSPSFEKIYATKVMGGLTTDDFRFELLNEKMEGDEGWVAVSDAMVILSPKGAKDLYNKLGECIELYEDEKGPIETDLEEEDKTY